MYFNLTFNVLHRAPSPLITIDNIWAVMTVRRTKEKRTKEKIIRTVLMYWKIRQTPHRQVARLLNV